MKKLSTKLLVLVLLLSLSKINGQEKKLNQIVDSFFSTYEAKNTSKAFDNIFSTNNLITKNIVPRLV